MDIPQWELGIAVGARPKKFIKVCSAPLLPNKVRSGFETDNPAERWGKTFLTKAGDREAPLLTSLPRL